MEDKIDRLRNAAAKLNAQVEEVNASLEGYEKLISECNPGESVFLTSTKGLDPMELIGKIDSDPSVAWFIDFEYDRPDGEGELSSILVPVWAKIEKRWGIGAVWEQYPDQGYSPPDDAYHHWSRLSRIQRTRLLLRVPALLEAVADTADRMTGRVQKLKEMGGVQHPAAKEAVQHHDVVRAVVEMLIARKAEIKQVHLDATEDGHRKEFAQLVGDKEKVRAGGEGGADVVAWEAGVLWIIEAKGTSTAQADEKLLKAVGRVLTRTGEREHVNPIKEVRYVIALPRGMASLKREGSSWEEVCDRLLPQQKRKQFNLHLLFVGRSGEVTHVSPDDVLGSPSAQEARPKNGGKRPQPNGDVAVAGMVSLGTNTQGYKEYRNEKDGSVLIYVPSIEKFRMGSDSGDGDERPVHDVALDGYLIGKYPVTNAQYRAFWMTKGGSGPQQPPTGEGYPNYFKDARFNDCPVLGVTWEHAKAYCNWAGLQLPTEAQWERAARGNDARMYPWGNEAPDPERAVYEKKQDGGEYTRPVDSHPKGASPFGALDMAGNVWEWCADWYDPKYYGPDWAESRNPTGPPTPTNDHEPQRVVRGGGWNVDATHLRAAKRGSGVSARSYPHIGFRVARRISP